MTGNSTNDPLSSITPRNAFLFYVPRTTPAFCIYLFFLISVPMTATSVHKISIILGEIVLLVKWHLRSQALHLPFSSTKCSSRNISFIPHITVWFKKKINRFFILKTTNTTFPIVTWILNKESLFSRKNIIEFNHSRYTLYSFTTMTPNVHPSTLTRLLFILDGFLARKRGVTVDGFWCFYGLLKYKEQSIKK